MNTWQSRTTMLIGPENVAKLNRSSIIVVGIGGVGSWCAESLVRSGIGKITLIDKDTIDPSNINRQLPALANTIGQSKVDVMANRLQNINPLLKIDSKCVNICSDNVQQLISLKPDYIVDAIDTISAKVSLIATAYNHGIPIISAMGAGNRINPSGFQVADISKTHTCPLARAVRQQLRTQGITNGVKTVFTASKALRPKQWDTETDPNKPRKEQFPPASMIFAPAVCGLTIAAEVINDLINK